MTARPKATPEVPRRAAGTAFELEVTRHPNGRVASLKVHIGRSFGTLILSLVAICRGNEFAVAVKGLISWVGK